MIDQIESFTKISKESRTAQPPMLRAYKSKCRMYTMACCVDFPAIESKPVFYLADLQWAAHDSR